MLQSRRHNGERTPQVGNGTQRPKRTVEAKTKMITSYKTTDRFVPWFTLHREYKTINLINVTYTIDKHSKMYKTRSSPKNINMKSSISHNLHFYNTRLHIRLCVAKVWTIWLSLVKSYTSIRGKLEHLMWQLRVTRLQLEGLREALCATGAVGVGPIPIHRGPPHFLFPCPRDLGNAGECMNSAHPLPRGVDKKEVVQGGVRNLQQTAMGAAVAILAMEVVGWGGY